MLKTNLWLMESIRLKSFLSDRFMQIIEAEVT